MKAEDKHSGTLIVVGSLIVIAMTLGAYILNGYFNPFYTLNTERLGHFGDFIGGLLGTLLTIIATIYVYKTYVSQRSELESQKQELIAQKEFIQNQQFETTFFNLLTTHRELKRDLSFDEKKSIAHLLSSVNIATVSPEMNKVKGQEVFTLVNNDLFKLLNQPELAFQTTFIKSYPSYYNANRATADNLFNFSQQSVTWNELEKIKNAYNYLFDIYKNQISHYSRNIYHILKFIRENERTENKGDLSKVKFQKYADIFQSQLTVEEQKLLFYNFIVFDKNNEDSIFWPINLLNHYKLLENLGEDNLFDSNLHNNKKFYTFDIK